MALFLVLSLTPITNNDIWLHLANGRLILETGEVPLADPYSFSAAGRRFHAHEWMAGVLFFLVHRVAGVPGLILFKAGVWAATLALVWLAARTLGAGPGAFAAVMLPALVALNQRFLERPEIFSFLLTALYLLVLVREHRALVALRRDLLRRRETLTERFGIWLLVPAQWLWVQLHGYFLTGLALVGVFLLAESVEQAWRGPRAGFTGSVRRLGSGWAALGTMAVIGLANPNGFEAYLFPFRLAGGANVFMETIREWRPPFISDEVTHTSFFLGFCLWLALLVTAAGLGGAVIRSRSMLCQAAAIGGLSGLVGVRFLLAAETRLPGAVTALASSGLDPAPVYWSTGLPASAWLWSPGQLLAVLSERPWARATVDAVLIPLRKIGPWADDLLVLLVLVLAALTVAWWRRPVVPALAAVIALLTFIFLLAGEWALFILAVTVAPALAVGLIRGRLAVWQAAAVLLFLVLAVRQNRNIANFVIVTLPLLAVLLGRLAAATTTRRLRRAGLAAIGLAAAALAGLTLWAGWPYSPDEMKHPGLGVGPRVPVDAVRYLRDRGITGNAFNKYAHGAYLIHELYPGTRVFMDSRNGVYGEELFDLYRRTLRSSTAAAATFERYRFDYVLIDYEFYPGRSDDPGLLTYLGNQSDWVLVYFDDHTLIYLPNRPPNAALIARDAYRRLDPAGFRPGTFAARSPEARTQIDVETRRALTRQPEARSTRLLRAEALLSAGNVRQAWALFEAVIEEQPADLYARVAAGRLAARLGETERAAEHFRFVLALRPGYDDVRRELDRLPTSSADRKEG